MPNSEMSRSSAIFLVLACIGQKTEGQRAKRQTSSSNTLGDFVGQLTSLINQGGGLLQQGGYPPGGPGYGFPGGSGTGYPPGVSGSGYPLEGPGAGYPPGGLGYGFPPGGPGYGLHPGPGSQGYPPGQGGSGYPPGPGNSGYPPGPGGPNYPQGSGGPGYPPGPGGPGNLPGPGGPGYPPGPGGPGYPPGPGGPGNLPGPGGPDYPPGLGGPGYPSGPYGGRPPYPGFNPPQTGFLGALSSIAQYDDLRCVPRLLCEVTSGSRPGYSGKQQSVLPFVSKDTLITLLTVLNFVDDSPLLVFARAGLLGYTAQGDPRACLTAYPTCPRDADRLVHYLNNHNGGFFRFFNQQLGQLPQYAPQYQQFQPQFQQYHPQQYPARPYQQRPQQLGRPPYPRQYGSYPQQYAAPNQQYYQQSRIQLQPQPAENDFRGEYSGQQQHGNTFYLKDGGKTLVFPKDGRRGAKQLQLPVRPAMVFPDRTGTGDLRLDLDSNGYYKGVYYAHDQGFRDTTRTGVRFPSVATTSSDRLVVFHQPEEGSRLKRRNPKKVMYFPPT